MNKVNLVKKIAFISFHFQENEGVGALRSRHLANLLEKRGNTLLYFTRKSFGERAGRNRILWLLHLFFSLIKCDFDKIYVTCGPFWHLLVLVFVAKIRRKKMIVDFRDPLSINLFRGNTQFNGKKFNIWKSKFIEKTAYRNCEHFWVCTPGMKEYYEVLFQDATKISVVLNGYSFDEREFFETEMVPERTNELSFVCLGKFAEYGDEKSEKALRFIEKACKREGKQFKIYFVGTKKDSTEKVVKRVGLANQVEFVPRRPYEESIQFASKADIGICIIRDEDLDFGTKVFDYIGLGLPIFNCFQKGSNFSTFFQRYLTCTDKKVISLQDRQCFKRDVVFSRFLSEIEK